jgi:hypothetical protein
VIIVAEHHGYETTTLREDVETDGRRAKVQFGRDWEADARRRDFTVNALYCEADGRIVDLVGGLDDIETRTIRFIGEAEERIREDYLRILRFFRFFAWYGTGRPDSKGLLACARLKDGLTGLSAERVWTEMRRLLEAPDPSRALLWMRQSGVLSLVLPEVGEMGHRRDRAADRHRKGVQVAAFGAAAAGGDHTAHRGACAVGRRTLETVQCRTRPADRLGRGTGRQAGDAGRHVRQAALPVKGACRRGPGAAGARLGAREGGRQSGMAGSRRQLRAAGALRRRLEKAEIPACRRRPDRRRFRDRPGNGRGAARPRGKLDRQRLHAFARSAARRGERACEIRMRPCPLADMRLDLIDHVGADRRLFVRGAHVFGCAADDLGLVFGVGFPVAAGNDAIILFHGSILHCR